MARPLPSIKKGPHHEYAQQSNYGDNNEMSMSDITTEIQYGATVAIASHEVKLSKMDIIRDKKERVGAEMGVKIANAKQWGMRPEGDLAILSLSIYVFSPNELTDYMNAKFKERLIEMAEDDWVDAKSRLVVRAMAERF